MSQSTPKYLILPLMFSALLMAGCSSEDQEAAKEKMESAKEEVSSSVSEMTESAKDSASEMTESAKETASDMAESTKNAASDMVDKTKEAATAATETATAKVEDAAEAVTAATSDNGKKVYDEACFACHAMGIAGAPKMGDAEAWTARIAQGNDVLYDHAINGYVGPSGAMMPAKGGRADLSDDDIKAAVDYMVASSQ